MTDKQPDDPQPRDPQPWTAPIVVIRPIDSAELVIGSNFDGYAQNS